MGLLDILLARDLCLSMVSQNYSIFISLAYSLYLQNDLISYAQFILIAVRQYKQSRRNSNDNNNNNHSSSSKTSPFLSYWWKSLDQSGPVRLFWPRTLDSPSLNSLPLSWLTEKSSSSSFLLQELSEQVPFWMFLYFMERIFSSSRSLSRIWISPSNSLMQILFFSLSYCISAGSGGLLMLYLTLKQLEWSTFSWVYSLSLISLHQVHSDISSSRRQACTQSSLERQQVLVMNSFTSWCSASQVPNVYFLGKRWRSSSLSLRWSSRVKQVRLKSKMWSSQFSHLSTNLRVSWWPLMLRNWLQMKRGMMLFTQHQFTTSSIVQTPRSISPTPLSLATLLFALLARNSSKPPLKTLGTGGRYIFFLRGQMGLQGLGLLSTCFSGGSQTILAMHIQSLLAFSLSCLAGSHTSSCLNFQNSSQGGLLFLMGGSMKSSLILRPDPAVSDSRYLSICAIFLGLRTGTSSSSCLAIMYSCLTSVLRFCLRTETTSSSSSMCSSLPEWVEKRSNSSFATFSRRSPTVQAFLFIDTVLAKQNAFV